MLYNPILLFSQKKVKDFYNEKVLDTTLKQFIIQCNDIAKKKGRKKWRMFFVKFHVLCYLTYWLSAAVIQDSCKEL